MPEVANAGDVASSPTLVGRRAADVVRADADHVARLILRGNPIGKLEEVDTAEADDTIVAPCME